jgi:hypothetical protein
MNNQIISKGIYSHPQTCGYVSVKQFIFLRVGNKKHLLLRFSNDLDVAVDSIAFTVHQLNADGVTIGKSHSKYSKRADSGKCFSADKAILVEESCVDVKVTVDAATSGAYEYSDRGGVVTVRYRDNTPKSKMARTENLILNTDENKEKTEQRCIRRLRLVAILAIALIILINVSIVLFPIIKREFFTVKHKHDGNIASHIGIVIRDLDI